MSAFFSWRLMVFVPRLVFLNGCGFCDGFGRHRTALAKSSASLGSNDEESSAEEAESSSSSSSSSYESSSSSADDATESAFVRSNASSFESSSFT